MENLQQIYRITDPEERLYALGVALDEDNFKMAIARVMVGGNGPIAPYTRDRQHRILKQRMLAFKPKPFADAHAHHDFPWAFRDWFALHGIDVNDPAFGRWVSRTDHDRWHLEEPKFNDFWQEYIDIETETGVRYTKQQIIDMLIEAPSIYIQ